jgi:hypothetical protein
MDSPHTRQYIQNLEIVREDGAQLMEYDLKTASYRVYSLFNTCLNFFLYQESLITSPSCKHLENCKALYDVSGLNRVLDKGTENLLQIAVFYFLRVPVVIGHEGYLSLSPIKPPRAEVRRAPREYNYFKDGESAEYLAFLHRWSADLTKCTGFFEYLTPALAQPLPAHMLDGVNGERASILERCVNESLSIRKLGACLQPLPENTTVYEFLVQLVQLAYYINQTNMWYKEVEAAAGTTKYYGFYNDTFARECIKMFYSFLITFMSPTRFLWLAAVKRAEEMPRVAGSFKFSRTGEEALGSSRLLSRPGAGAGVPRLALGSGPPRLAIEDASAVKSSPTWPGAGGPRLALKDASASASARDASRKRGRDGDGKASSRHGGRRNRSRHSSSKGRRRARSSSKCSIM